MKVVVINPSSGKGRGKKFYEFLIKNKNEFEILYSSNPAEQIDFINSNKEKIDEIWIAGGDGTINLFANKLDLSDFKIGIVPIGSGNDIARELKIKHDCIFKSNKKFIEINPGLVQILFNNGSKIDKIFLSSLSLGFIAEITKKSSETSYLTGLPLYLVSVFKTLKTRNILNSSFILDGKVYSGNLLMLTIGKTKTAGGGFKLTPGASIIDDYYEVSIARNVSNVEVLFLLPKVIFGSHTKDDHFKFYRFWEGDFSFQHPSIIQTDGEVLPGLVNKININKYNNKIRVIV